MNATELNPDIHSFRQPMVTSLGIILGFLLNFLAGWATTDDGESALQTKADWIVATTLLMTLLLMIYVLFRILDNRYRQQDAGVYYQTTFRLYIVSILMALVGLAASLFI
ncbi:MAG: hypothetical protein ACRCV6_06575 [Formosimonas sp.]